MGVLLQLDLEKRNRSSHEVGAGYNLVGEKLDSINPLYLNNLNLNDWIRINDRQNQLQVIDFKSSLEILLTAILIAILIKILRDIVLAMV